MDDDDVMHFTPEPHEFRRRHESRHGRCAIVAKIAHLPAHSFQAIVLAIEHPRH
jgi:hypothetical protein